MLYLQKSKKIGIGSIKTFLGKKKRRGSQPPKFHQAAGKVIREVVAQLKANGYVENFCEKAEHITFGMVLTKQGRTELDKIASKIMKSKTK